MSLITKEVKCNTCGSYIHDTNKCYVWKNKLYCVTDEICKNECNCKYCKNRCPYCNDILYNDGNCYFGHNNDRCLECNEFLNYGNCHWDHTKLFCQFCNLPIYKFNGTCINYHRDTGTICYECDMPEDSCHIHDGVKCKICNSLLNRGKCIYKCIDGGNICIHCNAEGVYNNNCWNCSKDNTGQFTKKAIK